MEKSNVSSKSAAWQEIYQGMVESKEYKDLMEKLILMQTQRNIPADTAKANTDKIVELVCAWEHVREEVAEAPSEVVKALLEEIKSSEKWELEMQKFYFGLTVHSTPEALKLLDDETTVGELFWRYYLKNKDTKTQQQLEQDILLALQEYDLSDQLLEALVKKIQMSDVPDKHMATAEALGKRGLHFKCIAAMECYCEGGGELSMQEAVNLACGGTEKQAAAAAVGKGLLSRDRAKQILIAAGIAVVVVGAVIVLLNTGDAVGVSKAAAAVVDSVHALPEIFAPFANAVTAAGGPGTLVSASSKIKMFYEPLRLAAQKKMLAGGALMAVGTAMVTLSRKTATLIGKFRAGFAEEKTSVVSGIRAIAQAAREMQAESPVRPEETQLTSVLQQKTEQNIKPM